jgi:hypothetical protein
MSSLYYIGRKAIKDKKQTQSMNLPTISNVSNVSNVSSASVDNLRDVVKKLQCDVKKLELNLKLVDNDYISNTDYNKLKDTIRSICDLDGGNTEKFFNEMDYKKNVNFIKRVVSYLQMISPICNIINLTIIPFVMKNIKHMGDMDRNKLLEKSFDTFNKMFQTLSTATSTDDVDVLGLVQNSIDSGFTDRIAENVSVTNMEDIKQKLFDVAKSLNVNTVRVVKKLINPFKTITNRGPRYNALVNKCNKLLGMICLSVWYYIIYAKLNNMSSDNDMTFILMGGRKKRKPKKKSNS